jgi:hypothetical protein
VHVELPRKGTFCYFSLKFCQKAAMCRISKLSPPQYIHANILFHEITARSHVA